MAAREAFIREMHIRLDKANHEVDDLVAKEEHVAAAAYAEYTRYIGDCRQRREELLAALEKFRECPDDSLEDMRLGLETAWELLSQELDSAREKFR